MRKQRGRDERGLTYQVVGSPIDIRFLWLADERNEDNISFNIEEILVLKNNVVISSISVQGMNIVQIVNSIMEPLADALEANTFKQSIRTKSTDIIDVRNLAKSFLFKIAKKISKTIWRDSMEVVYKDSRNNYAYTDGKFLMSTTDELSEPLTTIDPNTLEIKSINSPLIAHSFNRILGSIRVSTPLKIYPSFYDILRSLKMSDYDSIIFRDGEFEIKAGGKTVLTKSSDRYFDYKGEDVRFSFRYLNLFRPKEILTGDSNSATEIISSYNFKSFDKAKIILMPMQSDF